MDSTLTKDENNRKKISGKKHIVQSKSFGIKNPVKDAKNGQKQHFAENIKRRKKRKNASTFLSNTSPETPGKSNSNTNIENASDVSEKDVPVSLKAKRTKRLKKKITDKNMVLKANKCSDLQMFKNIAKKRKLSHFDSEHSPVKKEAHVKNKKKRLSLSKTLTTAKCSDSLTNDQFPQEAQTEGSGESDSNEDEEIRCELKNSSIFKNIQKLLKDNPFPLSSVDNNEEEHSEAESAEGLRESDLDEEFLDDTSSDDVHEKIKNVKKDVSTPLSIQQKSTSKSFNKTQNDSKRNEKNFGIKSQNCIKTSQDDEMAITTSTTSVCDFIRTERRSLTNKDETIISKKEASSLRNKALEKLQGAKFRYLNEKLYTESGKDSFNYFQENKNEYMDYHKGYNLQVAKWPLNPVDKIITSLQKTKKKVVIADMGCGDAKIAQTLSKSTVHSFDLVALNDFVTPCNISKVPLPNESVDVVVFCLSLMGTNLKEYLQEAYRIAKLGGILKIAEVESRIPSLEQFIKSIEALGFSLEKKDVAHKLFVFLEFKKTKKKKNNAAVHITLNPCLYKKR